MLFVPPSGGRRARPRCSECPREYFDGQKAAACFCTPPLSFYEKETVGRLPAAGSRPTIYQTRAAGRSEEEVPARQTDMTAVYFVNGVAPTTDSMYSEIWDLRSSLDL